MIWIVNLLLTFNVVQIDYITTRTIVRLWHDSYSHTDIKNNNNNLFLPRKQLIYLAVVNADEIKAIAACKRNTISSLTFSMISNAPNNDEICNFLIKELIKNHVRPDYETLKRQPRWYIASKFYE
tara:strand:- start:33 stop:407 length:375 start_codon:yes stop_codon:yes gene_type:complete